MKHSGDFKKLGDSLKKNWLLILIILVGGFLRFYNLNWDRGYFFHPDESNNIAHPAANLKPPFKPEKFVYGSLAIYLYRLCASIIAFLTQNQSWLKAAQINIVGRFISATISTCLIFLVFQLGKRLFSQKVGLLAAILTSINVGLIQAAHFGTTETILTLSGLLITIAAMIILRQKRYKIGYFVGAVSLGLVTAAKMSTLVFFPPLLLSHSISLKRKNFKKRNLLFFFSCGLMLLVFFLASPYSVLDYPAFKKGFLLEKNIATGKIPMFFTAQFQETKPYLFQITKILPWVLGWPVLIFGLLGLTSTLFQNIKRINKEKFLLFFLPTFYFLYNGSLFAKWTRYMVPLAPFFCLFTALFLIEIYRKSQKQKPIKLFALALMVAVVVLQVLYALAFFNIYKQPNTRITASEWIYENLPPKSTLLLEPLDVVALPLPFINYDPAVYNRTWFNFYSLDDHLDWNKKSNLVDKLSSQLAVADYVIIGSRRIYTNRLRLKNKYPLTARYYTLLFNEALGFDKIKEVSSYPKIFGIEINDDSAEETFQVFDHPKILIFKNTERLSADELKGLLLYD